MLYELRIYAVPQGRESEIGRRMLRDVPPLFARHGFRDVAHWIAEAASASCHVACAERQAATRRGQIVVNLRLRDHARGLRATLGPLPHIANLDGSMSSTITFCHAGCAACLSSFDAPAYKGAKKKQEDAMSTSNVATATQQAVQGNSLVRMQVVPTGAAVAAEIRGVDLSLPLPEDVKQAMRDAWAQHGVLLWRDQHIDDDQLLATAQIFGPTQEGAAQQYMRKGGLDEKNRFLFADNPNIGVISNLDEHGNPVVENDGLGSQEVVWHSDNSYVAKPPAGSMLYALEVPNNGGGDTSWNNQYLAYEELPEALKAAIRGRVQVHDSSRNSAGRLRPTAKLPTSTEEVEGPQHPLVRIHPVTGKPALYLGRRRVWPSSYIVGIPHEESETLLDALWAHATQPKYEWTHHWRVGDLMLWDNRCCMHYRTEIDPTQRRIMHRTVIKGEPVVAAA